MNIKRVIKPISIAAALCMTLFTMNAQALQNKMHHGANCHPFFGKDVSKLGHTFYGLYNESQTEWIYLICPLQRDYATHGNPFKSSMYLYHSINTQSWCWMQKVNNWGTGFTQTAGTWAGQYGTQITFPSIHEDPVSHSAVGLMCVLAPGGYINSIRYWDDEGS